MTRPIKFRAWYPEARQMIYGRANRAVVDFEGQVLVVDNISGNYKVPKDFELMQFTGLLDKNGTHELYEGDIINLEGQLIGNQYEDANLLGDKANLLIQGLGTVSWETTNKEALDRGCKYA